MGTRACRLWAALLCATALGAGTAACGSERDTDARPAGEQPGAEAEGPTFDSPGGEQSGQADPLDE
jgi:hypothetical protein